MAGMLDAARAAGGEATKPSAMRAIDPAKFAKIDRPSDFGPAAQLQWLEISKLVVDDSYQRPVAAQGEKTIRAIIAKFDWRMFAPVIVSPILGGLYAIVDGQHRTTAAAACGHEQVPCAIIMADRQAQAVAFGAINGVTTQVSRHQQFKAALAAGDLDALRIKAAADAARVVILTFNTASSNMKPRETCALEILKTSVARYGDAPTTAGLEAICVSADGCPGFLSAANIRACVEVLSDHAEWRKHPDLLKAFGGIDIEEFRRKAYAEAALRKGVIGQDLLQAAIITHLTKALKVAS